MKTMIKISTITLIALFFAVANVSGQNHPTNTKPHQHKIKENKGMMNNGSKMNKEKSMMNNIVRKGVIDVHSIDKNKDSKVYQDIMDWNVISDKPGKCPICGMKLKEVSIDKAKQNLKKHGFKTK